MKLPQTKIFTRIIVALLASTLIFACKKENLSYDEKRLLGIWLLASVKEQTGVFKRTDITNQYGTLQLQLKENNKAFALIKSAPYTGTWQVVQDERYNGDNHESVAILNINLSDTSGNLFTLAGEYYISWSKTLRVTDRTFKPVREFKWNKE